jgi:hypothetical protein
MSNIEMEKLGLSAALFGLKLRVECIDSDTSEQNSGIMQI